MGQVPARLGAQLHEGLLQLIDVTLPRVRRLHTTQEQQHHFAHVPKEDLGLVGSLRKVVG